MVLDWSQQEHRQAIAQVMGPAAATSAAAAEAAMRDVAIAPKLQALKDLLAQCGIISSDVEEGALSCTLSLS